MFLKNYTSGVPVSQTIYRIEQILIRCGVLGIAKEYKGTNGDVAAITFRIQDKDRDFTVRLPADTEAALQAMWLDYAGTETISNDGQRVLSGYKKKTRSEFAQQAQRTAWKIIQDWVEVQMSMIQMKQAEAVEVFLPYVWDGKSTVFGRIKAQNYKALLPERTE